MRNGRESVGGGIHNETTFTLLDCVITGNAATEGGGGINNLSTLTMSNCVIRANSVSGGTAGLLGGGINNQGTVTAINCTISSNSVAGGVGGGINNDGTVSLTNCVIRRNTASGRGGGGIFNEGTVTLDTSTVGSNSAASNAGPGQGGGIDNDLGTVTLNRSTVSGNLATGAGGSPGHGGGIANLVGTVIMENSTVSGNVASNGGAGGGILNDSGSVMLNHSTVASNSVPGAAASPGLGAGLFNSVGVVIIKNTILAANTASSRATTDVRNGTSGNIESGGFNLIGSTNGPVPPGPSDQFNLTVGMLRLGPLQDNGGPTFTHALLCSSPAINAGDNTDAPLTDQRGFQRIVGGTIDIGAYESAATTFVCPAPTTFPCAPASGRPGTISITVPNISGVRLVIVWTLNGAAAQTNFVPAGATAQVHFTTLFPVGTNQVAISVSDSSGCLATCSTTVTVLATGDLYPIALNYRTLVHVPVGGVLHNIYNGAEFGNFGWLTWAGSPSEPTLAASLSPPGNSNTYVNPKDRNDHFVSVGNWVQGKPGISNSEHVRKALNKLEHIDITVPVWDQATGRGNTCLYHVVAFARVRLLNYQLPHQNRITARFLGLVDCD